MNNTCLKTLLWTQTFIDRKRPQLCTYIFAAIVHSLFWLQVIFFPFLRQKSLTWIYSYMFTDALLICRFFFSYIIHTRFAECQTNMSWLLFNCYFEATADSYLNILEPYILLALNICRYIQIAYNRNVYEIYPKRLVIFHLSIYLIPLIVYISEFLFGWIQFDGFMSNNCDMSYTSVHVKVINIVFGCILPVSLNVLVISVSVRHVHLTTALRGTQYYTSARQKYQRALAIQFLCFYIIWLALWLPYIITIQMSVNRSDVISKSALASALETTIDPIIIVALDVQLRKVWRKIWIYVKKYLPFNQCNLRRIEPATINSVTT